MPTSGRIEAGGKFLRAGQERFLVKGVTYGTFAPDANGSQFPPPSQIADDFRLMAELGVNTVRLYTLPPHELLDQAARHGLRLMMGLPWSQHVAFLDDRRLTRSIRREVASRVREFSDHPAVLLFALGNEIPPSVVRWHGRFRVERFLRHLYQDAKEAAPDALFTYVNFPPTEFLDLTCFDVCSFNLYLHHERDLRAYLARLQHVAGNKPLLLAEGGADSVREGEQGQAAITATHIRAAFEEGACGAVAFAWTDEWWRGGHPIEEWAFGLVDRARKPKPAAASVAVAFGEAPFSTEAQRKWPRVSVVVCAYDAEETIDDCLSSLVRQTYPDYEIILVNDGSRDRTREIASRHHGVRIIDTPNSGLGAARNAGLAKASGEIVAYTDADTRADCDWLTYLVQPFLTSDVVGAGGPNVVPPDDPPMAQSVARAPGAPTHVLLDDRIAEHVPGCNMAFRREALLAVDGFSPIYLRAGDDVDVCWRLQARGWKIGFASSALVWHHHRSSLGAYWRQQVGYGEGEQWLMAHHPDKFLDGRMVWQGRIYSPLPFVRSLWAERVNSGVWGTAAFPSVYRADAHPFAFLPHSVKWQAFSLVLVVLGVIVALTDAHVWAASLLLGAGLSGVATTIAKNVAYAMRSDVDSLPGSRLWYRSTVAWLHFIQPFARLAGQVRSVLSPPAVALPSSQPKTSRGPRPSLRDAWRALLLLFGGVEEECYWTDAGTTTTSDRILSRLTDWLRLSRAVRFIEVDDGWVHDRDVSLLIGRWAWLDARVLVEDHGASKGLLRVGTQLRPTGFGVVSAISLAAMMSVAASAGIALSWPLAGASAATLAVAVTAFGTWRTALATTLFHHAVQAVAAQQEMTKLPAAPPHAPLVAQRPLRLYGLRIAALFVGAILVFGSGTFVLSDTSTTEVFGAETGYAGDNGPAADAWLDTPGGMTVTPSGEVYFADSQNHVIRKIDLRDNISTVVGNHALGPGFSGDLGSATDAQLDTPDGLAIAPDGDLLIADSYNDRVRRVDRETGIITTIAGSGDHGYDGDGKLATAAALNTPRSVAVAPNGDIYITDSLNYRIRVIDHQDGVIRTVAGAGVPPLNGGVGDGGPATAAYLNLPTDVAIAPNGDLYIADMHHQRVRRIDARSQVITTVAGSGRWGDLGDGGPATEAALAGPAGVALLPLENGELRLFIADHYNGRIRTVGPDGIIRDASETGRVTFGAPTGLAVAPRRGTLWVADTERDRLVALTIRHLVALPPRTPAQAVATTGGTGR